MRTATGLAPAVVTGYTTRVSEHVPSASLRLALLLLLIFVGGCNYVGDRALDAIDPFRASVGVGTTVGVRACGLGMIDSGLMIGVKPHATALGLRYGRLRHGNTTDGRYDADQAEIVRFTSIVDFDYGNGSYRTASTGAAVLPLFFTWSDATPTDYEWTAPEEEDAFRELNWLWSGETTRNNRYAQVHSLDIEFDLGLAVYGELGFSPGETLDFFLGIIGIDLAMDDDRIGGGK